MDAVDGGLPIGPFGALRRKDRLISDAEEVMAILDDARVMTLALADGGQPFAVPVYYAREGNSLWFHSAREGSKVRILRENPRLCFVVSLDQGFIPSESPCDFEARHRTAIGFGRACFVDDGGEKRRALGLIVARFSKAKFDFPQEAIERTLVVRVDIESLTGKRHGI